MTIQEFARLQPGDRVQCRGYGVDEEWKNYFVAHVQMPEVMLDDDLGMSDWACRLFVTTFPWQSLDEALEFRRAYCRLPISD